MAVTTSPPPPATEDVGPENSSAFYGFDYLDDPAFAPCRKEAVVAFGQSFLPAFYGLVFAFGLAANLLLLGVLLRRAPRRRVAEVYLLNLAVSNLLFVVTLPFWGVSMAWHWVFGSVLCKLVSTLYTINFYSGIFFISCLSLDQYLEIVHAWPCHRHRTRAKTLLLVLGVWAAALAVSVPDMVFVRTHEAPKGVWHCHADFGGHGAAWKLFLRFQQNLLGFLLPFLAMVIFYARIGCVLRRLRPPGRGRALRVAAGLVLAFFALWGPYNLTLLLHSLLDLQVFGDCEASRRLDYALQVTESVAFLHCCFSPVLYAFSSRRFRQRLKALLAAALGRQLAPGAAWAAPPDSSESSGLTVQEEMANMSELAQGPPKKGAVGES
ncbi:atypical chemokine receptor 2 [Dasypus novemcinctus]|uniref:atypical chemokine receptor 2 n=1 Tax=Dasypus novemcinctus TaxID=9361 RepID=UPI00265E7F15|nr:atypical chemokine receptor 2 [Dasypus novemcinctus]XP_012375407.2 atypical chemokine receptor 2 [Dasypus novemcinctus]